MTEKSFRKAKARGLFMNAARKMRARSYFMSGHMSAHVSLCATHVCVEPSTPCLENICVHLRPFAIPALWMLSYE